MKRTATEYADQAQQQLDAAYTTPIEDGTAGYHLARAQVYATLASAAAQHEIAQHLAAATSMDAPAHALNVAVVR